MHFIGGDGSIDEYSGSFAGSGSGSISGSGSGNGGLKITVDNLANITDAYGMFHVQLYLKFLTSKHFTPQLVCNCKTNTINIIILQFLVGPRLRRMHYLFELLKQSIDNNDLNTSIKIFNEEYELLLHMRPYIRSGSISQTYDIIIQKFKEIEFKIWSGHITIDDFKDYVLSFSNRTSIIESLYNSTFGVLGGVVNAIWDKGILGAIRSL